MEEIIGTVKFQNDGLIVPVELAKFNGLEIEKIYEILYHLVENGVVNQINYQCFKFTELFLREHKFENIKQLTVL